MLGLGGRDWRDVFVYSVLGLLIFTFTFGTLLYSVILCCAAFFGGPPDNLVGGLLILGVLAATP